MRPALTSSRSLRIASLSMARAAALQDEIRAAGLEAGEIDRDVEVTELAKAPHDCFVTSVLPQARQVVVRDLEPRQPVVMPDAKLPEAERAHELLGGIDL